MTRCVIAGAAATYALAIFQATLGERLAVAGVSPDLLFVWTVCLGLLGGPRLGVVAGFGSGLLEGSLRQAFIGGFAVSKSLSGFIAGVLTTRLFRENWLVPAVSAGLLTLVNEAVFLALSGDRAGWAQAGRLVGVRMAYHGALAPFGLALIARARRAMAGRPAEAG